MPILVRLDVMLAKRQVRSNELAEVIGITESNLSLLKSGKVTVPSFEGSESDRWLTGSFDVLFTPASFSTGTCPDRPMSSWARFSTATASASSCPRCARR